MTTLDFTILTDAEVGERLDDLSRLRRAVFRDWPYLYDGDPENEDAYLESYAETPAAILVAAWHEDEMVGCATGMPLRHHADAREVPLDRLGLAIDDVFYCAESVLLPDYRGLGAGHVFFDRREAHALKHGYATSLFCAVERADDHPAKPAKARALAPFWEGRGYAARDATLIMSWTDLGDDAPSEKSLKVWTKAL